MADVQAIADNFVKYYCSVCSEDPGRLGELYQAEACLSVEGSAVRGTQGIMEKLKGFPKFHRTIRSLDAQPGLNGSVLIYITGQLCVENETNAQLFNQVFCLVPHGTQFLILNDILRLGYG